MGISPIFLGIIVMLSWGTADVLTALFTRKSTILSAFLYAQLGMVILYSFVAFFLVPFPMLSGETMALLLIAGALSTLGYLAFCKGMQLGPVSVASAIIGCTPVVTVLLTTMFLGENITGVQAGGIALAVAGAVLTSLKFTEMVSLSFSKIEKAALYGFVAFVSWGIFYAVIEKLTSSIGWLYPLFLAKVVSVAMFGAYLAFNGTVIKTIRISMSVWAIALGVIVLEFVGHISYGFGVSVEQTAIINPISFSYPLVAVGLAHAVFRERLEATQYAGIGMTLIGIVLLVL